MIDETYVKGLLIFLIKGYCMAGGVLIVIAGLLNTVGLMEIASVGTLCTLGMFIDKWYRI